MRLNKLNIAAFVLVIIGIFIFFTDAIDYFIITITWPLLSGSSEGKAILLFIGMGSLLLLNSLIISRKGFLDKFYQKLYDYSPEGKKYLKIVICIALLTYLVGIIVELFIRSKYGVSPFTIFVSLNPAPTSTSPMHSHVFKSVLGQTLTIIGFNVPGHINTGGSLFQQVYPWAFLILLTLPIAYISGLFSLNSRRDLFKIILAFSLTLTFIGMIDGGLFSQPGVIGLGGILGIYSIRSPFKLKQLLIPALVIISLIMGGVIIETIGSNPSYHEITIINPSQSIDLSGYPVLSTKDLGDRIIITIKTDRSDKILLENLFQTLGGKADGFFMTWNFASYFSGEYD